MTREVVMVDYSALMEEADNAIRPSYQPAHAGAIHAVVRGRIGMGALSPRLEQLWREWRAQTSSDIAAGADEEQAKASLRAILRAGAPRDSMTLLRLLNDGKIDGDYGATCVVGRIGATRGMSYVAYRMQLYMKGVMTQPLEDWLHYIHAGHTPHNNSEAAKLEQWILEFLREIEAERLPLPQPASLEAIPAFTVAMPHRVRYELEGAGASPAWGPASWESGFGDSILLN